MISGGIVDSFSMVSLKRFLENRYQIQIPDDDATPEVEVKVYGVVRALLNVTPGQVQFGAVEAKARPGRNVIVAPRPVLG